MLNHLKNKTGLTTTELWLALLMGAMLWVCMAALWFFLSMFAAAWGAI